SGDGNGIIRWDLTDGSSQRVVSGTDYVDLTIGLNGKLYALTVPVKGEFQKLDVFDPFTLAPYTSITLKPKAGADTNFTGVAVNALEQIFVVEFDNPDVYRFSPTGVQVRHRRLQAGALNNLMDIDVSDDGWLLMSNEKGFAVRMKAANLTGNDG